MNSCILCPALTQSSSTQPYAAHAFRNLCDPTSIVTHICEFSLLTDHILHSTPKNRHVQIAARMMMFMPTSQQLLVACSGMWQPVNHSVPNLQLVVTPIAWLYTLRACCMFDCRYQTCLIHATVHPTGCNTVKLTVYTGWSVLTPRCHTGRNTGVNTDQPVYTPFKWNGNVTHKCHSTTRRWRTQSRNVASALRVSL